MCKRMVNFYSKDLLKHQAKGRVLPLQSIALSIVSMLLLNMVNEALAMKSLYHKLIPAGFLKLLSSFPLLNSGPKKKQNFIITCKRKRNIFQYSGFALNNFFFTKVA